MARTISPALATALAEQFGEEPVTVIEVQWAVDGQRHLYGDKDVPASNVKGRIMQIGNLDFVINVNDGSDSADIEIVLSDIDGHLKNIIDTVDVHKRDVWVYQWMKSTSFSDKALVFQGEINSPLIWNEGDRTLKFAVVSKIEDAEIGFSIEEGNFLNPPTELIGVPWPLKFGTTINVPALRFTSPVEGTLVTGVGISDFTLPFRIDAAEDIICQKTFRGYTSTYSANGLSLIITPFYYPDEGCMMSRCENITNLKRQLREQRKYEFEKITILDGEKFPQGTVITLDIDGGKFTGRFLGTTETPSKIFEIASRKHPDFDELGGIPTESKVNKIIRDKLDEATNNCGPIEPTESVSKDQNVKDLEESEKSIEFFNAIPTADFFWATPGSKVTLDSDELIVYCTNLLPETVHVVTAYRQFEAGKKLVTVPPSYYTVRTADFNTYLTTELVFDKPLSKIDDTWEDDLYVTSTSTVGPNTVDIMIWLISKYTNLTYDTVSFDYVRERLENYPSDFPILERKNILTCLQEIAFQCRCAIYLRDRKFYLKYLSEQPEAITDITESDVDANTLELFHTDTEDLVTKLVAEWKRDYSLEDPNKIILRHNIKKYGVKEEVINWYIYNELDYIHKSATFWLLRKANTWKQLRFSTPIHKLILETFDGVDLILSAFVPGTIRGLISKSDWNSATRTLDFEVWTPVKSGTTVAYNFAWPADISEELIWPEQQDYDLGNVGSGDAPGFTADPPAGHPLSEDFGLAQGYSFGPCGTQVTNGSLGDSSQQTCGNGNGDKNPSDSGDSKKEKSVGGGAAPDSTIDPGEINTESTNPAYGSTDEDKEAELERRIDAVEKQTASNQARSNNANEKAGGKGSGTQDREDDDFLPDPDDLPASACKHFLSIFNFKITSVSLEAGGLSSDPGAIGRPAGSQFVRTDKLYFDTFCETTQAGNALNEQVAAKFDAWEFVVGEVAPISAVRTEDTFCTKSNCDRQDRDEDGNPIGYKPIPTASSSEIHDEAGNDDDDNQSPGDYFDSLIPYLNPEDCKNEDCPPVEE